MYGLRIEGTRILQSPEKNEQLFQISNLPFKCKAEYFGENLLIILFLLFCLKISFFYSHQYYSVRLGFSNVECC